MKTAVVTDASTGIDEACGRTPASHGRREQRPVAYFPVNEGAR